ncbi:MAG: hypothetical protein ACRYFU_22520 [Janthinobacterium lividum]
MADLQLAPARERSVLPAVLIALLVLSAVAAAVFWFNPHRVSDLHVMEVQTFAPHTEMKSLAPSSKTSMRVLDGAVSSSEDNLYVVATMNFTDRLRIPIYVSGVTAVVTFADGTQTQARMIAEPDLKRLEAIFPALVPLAANPILDEDQIDPGTTRVGTVVLLFPGQTAEAWNKKRDAKLTVELRNQEPQTARLP